MKRKIMRMAATAIALQLAIAISATNAFDDDLMKLQQEQFRLQRQLQEQQLDLDRQLTRGQFNQQRQFTNSMRLQEQPWEQYRPWPQISPTLWLRDHQVGAVRTDWLSQKSAVAPLFFSLSAIVPSRLAYNVSGLSSGFMPVWFNRLAIGTTPEAATYALTGMRGGGGHAMRHWIEGGLIPDKYSLAIRRESFFRPGAQAILEDPLMTFETKLGSTRATGYLGRGAGGKWDSYQAVFIASEGPYKGRVISAYSDLPLDQQVRWRISKWDSLDDLSARTASKLRAVQGAFMILDASLTAAQTFIQTMDYVGKSMQMMNPPTYLQNNPRFTPSQTVLGIPITGTREGFGSYSIPGQWGGYREILATSNPGPITRLHTEWATNEYGSYYRREQVTTPSVSGLERFMVTHYPLGSYWDETSTVSYTQSSSAAWRETYANGVLTVTPLNNFGTGGSLGTTSALGYGLSGLNSTPSLFSQQQYGWNSSAFTQSIYSALGNYIGQQTWLRQQQQWQIQNQRQWDQFLKNQSQTQRSYFK